MQLHVCKNAFAKRHISVVENRTFNIYAKLQKTLLKTLNNPKIINRKNRKEPPDKKKHKITWPMSTAGLRLRPQSK
jgi:hypothetical protein